jgi:hypothetical protein
MTSGSVTQAPLRVGIVTGAGERFFCAGWDAEGAEFALSEVTLGLQGGTACLC